jgi:hypothetical protein
VDVGFADYSSCSEDNGFGGKSLHGFAGKVQFSAQSIQRPVFFMPGPGPQKNWAVKTVKLNLTNGKSITWKKFNAGKCRRNDGNIVVF